jgi:hypothetical protein
MSLGNKVVRIVRRFIRRFMMIFWRFLVILLPPWFVYGFAYGLSDRNIPQISQHWYLVDAIVSIALAYLWVSWSDRKRSRPDPAQP